MRNVYCKEVHSGVINSLLSMLFGLVVLGTAGCGPGENDGQVINLLLLPTDLRLDLYCADVGINTETCVLDDPENPYVTATIREFDVNNPGEENKFELAGDIPGGPTGAKARFYFWATALARRSSGENQFYTAVALHELYTAGGGADGGSLNAREQAKRAYRSVLDNYFGSVTFFSTCDFLFPSPPEPEFFYSVIVSDAAGVNLVDPSRGLFSPISFTECDGTEVPLPDLETLYPADRPVESEFAAKEELGEWGYSYIEVENSDTVFVTVSNFGG